MRSNLGTVWLSVTGSSYRGLVWLIAPCLVQILLFLRYFTKSVVIGMGLTKRKRKLEGQCPIFQETGASMFAAGVLEHCHFCDIALQDFPLLRKMKPANRIAVEIGSVSGTFDLISLGRTMCLRITPLRG